MRTHGQTYLDEQIERYNTNAGSVRMLQTPTLSDILKAEEDGCIFHGSHVSSPLYFLRVNKTHLSNRPAVFAGKPWMALTFTSLWNDDEFAQGTVNGEPYFRSKTPDGLNRFKRPGYLYQLSPLGFKWSKALTGFEFISERDVTPLSAVLIPNPLNLIKELGVDIRPI